MVGALLAALLTGLNNDIYLQVGLITTIGVSAKNAILIVEFAEERVREGWPAFDAAVEAAKLRLRPILMTSLAFVFGVLPLAISTGAGAGGQNAIGRAGGRRHDFGHGPRDLLRADVLRRGQPAVQAWPDRSSP